ncbi:flagellar export chaperone FliS [Oceanicoccus sagamiensis]|uniref:Flagellar secretion chaperone FliS n=1 Tax=Oceanicoccus sagamiensis TaxID=716816 RepID=A0A1X9N4J5_9GAMM|nr:flagellar export chaperone FliS [Oceanicoccus sagamiensis]ARN73050.1 flagellar export chaperone FliS [Oceanicoccus sagamiensis]
MLNKGLAQYQQVNTGSGVEDASPHRLIQMLMEGMLQRLAEAKGAIQRNSASEKGEAIGKAVTIVAGLRNSLNKEVGGEMADNLDDLYDYMQRRLLEANIGSSEDIVDEVMALMRTIKSGWDGIAEEVA